MFQGLLAVFYNLGDRPYNLTLPFHRLDNGEWHEVELHRHGKEFTLQLDGGGGRREVTAAPGRSQEIVIDQSVVMLGNSFPSGHNRSFLGCLRDLRLNGRPMPIAKQPSVGSEGLQVVTSQGVSPGCPSDACRNHQCSPPFICMDLWRKHECRCPPGHMMKKNASGKVCVYTLCASRPCRHGTCVAHSPSKYSCHCSEGYRGRHCEVSLALYHNDDNNTLSLSSAFAISICVLAFLVLMLGLFLYSCWRRHKGLKESVYHVSAHHGEWEDIRENVLNYDEEGGGEHDQNVFNMVELQRSLQPSPAQSLRYSYPQCIISYPQTTKPPDTKNGTKPKGSNGPKNGSTAIALRLAHPPSGSATLPSPLTMRRSHKSLSFSSQDLARYLCEVIRDTDHPLGDNPGYMTSPRLLSNRGQHGGLAVRSLSSLSAGGQGSEVRVQGSQESLERQRAQSPRLDRLKALRAVVSELRVDTAVDSAATKSTEGQKDKVKEREGAAQL
ncbi:neural-cadherin-like [Salmo salar]|uniref:Neural-cadherin-like n=1 Tax=Salmo salar TaxID=8030 RepID=A0ABM3CDR5_SALSA|nr:neural-cadherin-like [Salmo salar]